MENFITKLSLVFIKRARLTVLVALFLLAFGYLSFSSFLKREGFPAVEIPVISIQTSYFANDAAKVDSEVTSPIENTVSEIPSIKEIRSFTSENFSFLSVTFEDDVELSSALEKLRNQVAANVTLPAAAKIKYETFNGGSADGQNDFAMNLVSNQPTEQLQLKAEEIVSELIALPGVESAVATKLITQEKNPSTGEAFDFQSNFNRAAYKIDGKLVFQPAISIGVNAKKDVSSTKLSAEVKEKMSALSDKGDLRNYSIIYNGDTTIALNKQIKSLEENALFGVLIIILVLFLFINWRTAIVLAIFLPLTLGSVFIALYLFGYSLNTISLFALILVLGIFVDDGTIVVEAIDYYRNQGLGKIDAVKAAVSDIGVADVCGTLTTILVFVPMMFISGILGKFIFLIPVTIVLAMALSVIIALTILPLLSSWILKENTFSVLGKFVSKASTALANYTSFYLNKKRWAAAVLVASLLIIIAGSFFATKVKFSVFPAAKDTDLVQINYEFPENTNLEAAQVYAAQAEQVLIEEASRDTIIANYISGAKDKATVFLYLEDRKDRPEVAPVLIERLNQRFQSLPFKAQASAVGAGPPSDEFPFKMQLFENDLNKLTLAANDVSEFLKQQKLPNDVSVAETKVSNLNSISKLDKRRYAEISVKYNGTSDTNTVLKTKEAVENHYNEDKLRALGLSKDAFGFNFGQESENLASFQSTITALVFALLLIYVLLLLQFNSFTKPLLILLAIPFALPGVFPGLFFTNNALSFFSVIGIIALAGIVVNNSIMLLEYAEHAKKQGKTSKEAIIQAIRIRFRPILTTSITTTGALLPLGLSDPFWEALTFSIIFGLLSSTILILLSFPVYYMILEKSREKVHRWLRVS